MKDPWNQTDAELQQSQKLLIAKKKNVRLIWSSETNLWEAFGSGDIWIAYAWPNDWVQMKKKKLPVVYMRPKEKPIAWVGMMMLLKGTPRYNLAHAYVDAWSSARRRNGSRTTTATGTRTRWRARRRVTCCMRCSSRTRGPSRCRTPTSTATSRGAREYAKLWEEVKAS